MHEEGGSEKGGRGGGGGADINQRLTCILHCNVAACNMQRRPSIWHSSSETLMSLVTWQDLV